MDDELIRGLYPKAKSDNAPDFVIGKLSINVPQFREWMKAYVAANPNDDWINIDMKVSKAGKGYAKMDTWEPEAKAAPVDKAEPLVEVEDIPF